MNVIAMDFRGGLARDSPDLNKRVARRIALGRAGLFIDVGPIIASSLSDDHHWVNAQRIEITGSTDL